MLENGAEESEGESKASVQQSAEGEERLSIWELPRELSGVFKSHSGYPELKGEGRRIDSPLASQLWICGSLPRLSSGELQRRQAGRAEPSQES